MHCIHTDEAENLPQNNNEPRPPAWIRADEYSLFNKPAKLHPCKMEVIDIMNLCYTGEGSE